jgi:tRNA-dihydrouridine synthase A
MNQVPEISVAPMMDWTDRHCRYFMRLISPRVKLYSEMITTGAIIHGDRDRFLRFDESEHPVALQLGGSDAKALGECAAVGEQYGYDEINLNCGCPSDRVQQGRFGACLMKEPDHVADCVKAMISAVKIPVTVKCRIGVDEQDDFGFLDNFVKRISDVGCKTFVVHARKAWLSGLSPKENREIPPLMIERVAEIKEKYKHLRIILNGGIGTIPEMKKQLQAFDGAMIGRLAYHNPYVLASVEREIFGNENIPSREEIARRMVPYIDKQVRDHGTPVKSITRHMINLYQGLPGARAWRRSLSTLPYQPDADSRIIDEALKSGSLG